MSYSSKLQRETVLGSVIIRPTANAFSRGCSIVRKKTPATPTPARLRVHYKNLSTRREKIFIRASSCADEASASRMRARAANHPAGSVAKPITSIGFAHPQRPWGGMRATVRRSLARVGRRKAARSRVVAPCFCLSSVTLVFGHTFVCSDLKALRVSRSFLKTSRGDTQRRV